MATQSPNSDAQRVTETFGQLHGARVVRVCVRLALLCALFLFGLPLGDVVTARFVLKLGCRLAFVYFVDSVRPSAGVLAGSIVRAAWYCALAPSLLFWLMSCTSADASASVSTVCKVAGLAALAHRAVLLTTAFIIFTGPEVRAVEKKSAAGAAAGNVQVNPASVERRAAKLKKQRAYGDFLRYAEWGDQPVRKPDAIAKLWKECVSDSCYFSTTTK